jgi:sugar phosphate isomerase/epimerase
MKTVRPKIGFKGSSLQDVLEEVKFAIEKQFDYFEINGVGGNFSLSSRVIQEIKKISKRANVNLRFHIAYFLPISSSIHEISKMALKFAKKNIIIAEKLGAKWITMHSGRLEAGWIKEMRTKQKAILVKNLRELVNSAKKFEIEINLENSWRETVCVKPNELLEIVRLVPGLKIVLDVGHANVAGLDPIKFFEKVRKYLSAVHVHDNKGNFDEHLPIGKGNIKFREFVKKCKELKFYGPFIIETFPKKNVLKTRKTFLKFWNKT